MNWVDLTGTPCLVLEPEPLITFNCLKPIFSATFEEEPLKSIVRMINSSLPLEFILDSGSQRRQRSGQ
jgi:hypothetical protein